MQENILPKDGEVIYIQSFYNKTECENIFTSLWNEISWKQETCIVFGKRHELSRKVAWYGDEGLTYNYSNQTKIALPWNSILLKLKNKIEIETNVKFNSCLLNLYHNGTEGMGWHSDNEKELEANGCIASLSFGCERKFSFKHKTTNENISILLENGSLLLMKGETQNNWHHALPKSKKYFEPRINLTFRKIIV